MLKKYLSFMIALGLAFSILLPSTFVHADDEDDAETEEQADEEESDDEEDEESEENASSSDESEDLTIYFYVVGFVVVLTLGMYAFTEGRRKK